MKFVASNIKNTKKIFMNLFLAISNMTDQIIFNESVIEEKRELFLAQLNSTREISVLAYNSLLLISENRFLSNHILVNEMPLDVVLSFLEKSVNELSNSLYEEMASISCDIVWLEGITDYLLRRFNKIKSMDLLTQNYQYEI